MAIQAIAIPIKTLNLSQLIVDQDLDLSTYALRANTIKARTGNIVEFQDQYGVPHGSISSLGVYITKGELDAVLKNQGFTAVAGIKVLKNIPGVETPLTATLGTWEEQGTHFTVPPGFISGTIRLQCQLSTDDVAETAYARWWNVTRDAILGMEQSVTGTTPTVRFQSVTKGTDFDPGDIIRFDLKIQSIGYVAICDAGYVGATLTPSVQTGTVSW